MKKVSEHTKKLRAKTNAEWQKDAIKEGAYNLKAFITDKKLAEIARNLPDKTKFVVDCLKEKYGVA